MILTILVGNKGAKFDDPLSQLGLSQLSHVPIFARLTRGPVGLRGALWFQTPNVQPPTVVALLGPEALLPLRRGGPHKERSLIGA